MILSIGRSWVFLLVALLLGCAAAPQPAAADNPEKATALTAALDAGKPFILVVSPADPGQAVLESESYGDWASALAALQARAPSGLPVVTASSEEYGAAIGSPAVTDGFATLFVNGRGRALLHQSRLVDPFLYDCGANYLRGKPSCAEVPDYGMPEVPFTRR
jgi:hypothetical protein